MTTTSDERVAELREAVAAMDPLEILGLGEVISDLWSAAVEVRPNSARVLKAFGALLGEGLGVKQQDLDPVEVEGGFDPRWWEKSPALPDGMVEEIRTQGGHFARVLPLDDNGGFRGGCVCAWFGQHRTGLSEASIDVKLHLLESA